MSGSSDKFAARLPIVRSVRKWLRERRGERLVRRWRKRGSQPPPPHIVKQKALRSLRSEFGLKILVETGTYHGDMIQALKADFASIYSIELGHELAEKARARFADDPHVTIIEGDSGTELGRLVPCLEGPALFWLDGHYSAGETARGAKDSPILEELSHILSARISGHVIAIDDARCFGVDKDYPSIGQLTSFVQQRNPGLQITLRDDAIFVLPAGPK